MVSLRDGKILDEVDTNVVSRSATSSTKEHSRTNDPNKNTGKKRKSDVIDESQESIPSKKQATTSCATRTEEEQLPSDATSKDAGKYGWRDHIDRERTPGREGPIKEEDRDCEPNIKPFKGEKGHKVRKTHWEKEEEYAQFAFENEGHTFHELHVCHRKGPKGSPTYDKSGFTLDWKKVDEWMKPKPYNKSAIMRGMDNRLEKRRQEREEMAKIFFVEGEAPADDGGSISDDVWKERVSQDLNIAWHKIGIQEFKQWEKMGFKKARKGEYAKFDDAGQKRNLRLMSSASLRK